MIVGVGYGPLAYHIRRISLSLNNLELLPYPLFYDNKKLLLTTANGYIYYFKELVRLRNVVKIALWPDNISLGKAYKVVNISLLGDIAFIVPVHSLDQLEIVEELKAINFRVFTGYASDKRYRNYELREFLRESKGPLWYLGVSTKRELLEAKRHCFSGLDITGYVVGTNEIRKNPEKLNRVIKEMLTYLNAQGRQTRITEFLSVNSPVNVVTR
ncbi:hypothetical protein [Saccharolobus shibatae]|uniref:Uncharacterized protein n=1 Tax=Saccharolobus shibatae TaxID=2286 RepID=A0A8F5BSD8_9CREN|nr:hypothetical protein [Saccharolobus shibatae]QXJ30326.1 hypothetical protein J5U21_p0068 [Saccharolobus shibatae]QXJ30428.1 hypothetical protein J5U21_00068 [Saccharolobus shibatae]